MHASLNVTSEKPTNDDWITAARKTGRMLTSKEVALILGYRNRSSFWGFVAREGVPIVRLSSRSIRFPAAALHTWLAKRSSLEEVQ